MGKKEPGGGPGTYSSHGVRCTMDPPFKKGAEKGSQQNMGGTFNHGRSGGDNGLPTHVYDPLGGPGKAGKPSGVNSLGTVKTEGSSKRRR